MTPSLTNIKRVKIGTGKRRNYEKKWIRHDIFLSNTKEESETIKDTNQSIIKERVPPWPEYT